MVVLAGSGLGWFGGLWVVWLGLGFGFVGCRLVGCLPLPRPLPHCQAALPVWSGVPAATHCADCAHLHYAFFHVSVTQCLTTLLVGPLAWGVGGGWLCCWFVCFGGWVGGGCLWLGALIRARPPDTWNVCLQSNGD